MRLLLKTSRKEKKSATINFDLKILNTHKKLNLWCKISYWKVEKIWNVLYVHPRFTLVRGILGIVMVTPAKNQTVWHDAKADHILLGSGPDRNKWYQSEPHRIRYGDESVGPHEKFLLCPKNEMRASFPMEGGM